MRYVLQVISRAKPGREADYEEWYAGTHLKDVLSLPGFLSCRRYYQEGPGSVPPPKHVAAYEVETDDPARFMDALFAASASMAMTDAIDLETARFEFLRAAEEGVPEIPPE